MNTKNAILISCVLGATLVAFSFSISSNPQKNSSSILHQNLLAIEDSIPTQAGKKNFLKQSGNLTKAVDPELVDLDSQIISCGASVDSLLSDTPTYENSCVAAGGSLSSTKGMYLGGQCCSSITDTKEYHGHLEKLQAYKNMPDIILDPMHTPIELAKKWIDYDKNTILTPDDQKIYHEAYTMSEEKPCCCKCWHYFVNEGIAKKMIKDGQYNSKDIADYWDNSDICGA